MLEAARATLTKAERLTGQVLVDELFSGGGGHSVVSFPLRAVYAYSAFPPAVEVRVRLLLSVPKRHLRHAVDRNRVKRQLREAFRRNKQIVAERVPEGKCLSLAFVWMEGRLMSTSDVERRVRGLLLRLASKLTAMQ